MNIFHIFSRNINNEYSLAPLHLGGSNEYLQIMFKCKDKKTCIPLYTPRYEGSKLHVLVGMMGTFILSSLFKRSDAEVHC